MTPAPSSTAALRLLIVDDEPLARARLLQLLEQLRITSTGPAVQVVGQAENAAAAIESVAAAAANNQSVQAVLLDIGLPGQSGLGLAKQLRAQTPPVAVVFVTAPAEHALAAFDVEAADYLTKPVRAERLAAALQRAALRCAMDAQGQASTGPMASPANERSEDSATLLIPSRGRVLRLPHAEIVYIKAEQKLLLLRTATSTHWLEGSLTELGQGLGAGFIRVHRNALVAVHAIRALELRAEAEGGEAGSAAGVAGVAGARGSSANYSGGGEDEGETWAVQVAPIGEWLAVSRRQVGAVRGALSGASGGASNGAGSGASGGPSSGKAHPTSY